MYCVCEHILYRNKSQNIKFRFGKDIIFLLNEEIYYISLNFKQLGRNKKNVSYGMIFKIIFTY